MRKETELLRTVASGFLSHLHKRPTLSILLAGRPCRSEACNLNSKPSTRLCNALHLARAKCVHTGMIHCTKRGCPSGGDLGYQANLN